MLTLIGYTISGALSRANVSIRHLTDLGQRPAMGSADFMILRVIPLLS